MCPQLGVDLASLDRKNNPEGWYDLRLKSFKPQKTKDGTSVNLNPSLEILAGIAGNFNYVYTSMSLKMPQEVVDIVHGMGLQMEANGNIPGDFKADPADPDNVEKWRYEGPMLGKTLHAELMLTSWNGQESLKIRQIKCAVPGCKAKHSTNLQGKKK